jgi:magnesium transporter
MATVPALDRPVTEFLASASFTLRDNLTIDEALAALRAGPRAGTPTPRGGGGVASGPSPVAYFYIVNEAGELVGVLPTRRLILAPGGSRIADLMTRDLIVLSDRETLFDALELFAMHRLLALPVVDARRRFLGIVEVSLYADEVFDLAEHRQLNEVFQLAGLRLEQHKRGGVLAGFKLRMPWLLANVTGGLVCAALGSLFAAAVEKTVLIALFIPLILTLAESISVQSMTLAIEEAAMRRHVPGQTRKESLTALLLGVGAGLIVGLMALVWAGPPHATLLIGGAVAATMFLAAMLGRAVPQIIHLLKLNPRIASGPITLAIVDVVTITLYLSAATVVLGG